MKYLAPAFRSFKAPFSGLAISGLAISGLAISGLAISGLTMAGLSMAGLFVSVPPMLLLLISPTLWSEPCRRHPPIRQRI